MSTIVSSPIGYLAVRDIIDSAFRLIRGNDAITALDRENGLFSFRLMVRNWQAEGIGLWKDDEIELPLCCGQTDYVVDRYLNIRNIRRKLEDGTEIMLGWNGRPASRAEYMQIPSKTDLGRPVQAYYWMTPTTGKISVWPAPSDTTESLLFTARLPFQNFVLDSTIDFPPEWLDALRLNLYVRLALEYGGNVNPATAALAQEAKAALFAFDTDVGSTYFQPAYL